MPEPASEFHARVLAAAPDGRLPAPATTAWETFPWEVVDGALVPKALDAPAEEAPREGEEGGKPCSVCTDGVPAEQIVWEDENWILATLPERSGLPLVLILWTRAHLDAGDLDDDQASEFGRIANRLVRITQGLPEVGRMHVHRWGDGSSHFHAWFVARPRGLAQLRGYYAIEWNEILPPVDEATWRADLHAIATKLANWGGHARI